MRKTQAYSAKDTSSDTPGTSYLYSRGGTRTRDPGIMRNARPREPRNRGRISTVNSDDDDSPATNGVVPPIRPDVCHVEPLERFTDSGLHRCQQPNARGEQCRHWALRGLRACVVHQPAASRARWRKRTEGL